MNQELRAVSTKELAVMLSIPEKTLRNWTSQKKIPHYKIGALVRFDLPEIMKWYQGKKVEQLSEPLLRNRIPDL
jgi:excisionase family DNA binding protein